MKTTQSRLLKLHIQCQILSFSHFTYISDTISLYKRNQASCTQWLNPHPPAFGPVSLPPPCSCRTLALPSGTTATDHFMQLSVGPGRGGARPQPWDCSPALSPRGRAPVWRRPGDRPPRACSCAPGPWGSPAPGDRRPRPPHRHPRGPRPIQPRRGSGAPARVRRASPRFQAFNGDATSTRSEMKAARLER